MKIVMPLLMLIMLTSCAIGGFTVDEKKFLDYSSDSYFLLTSDVKYSKKRGLGFMWETGIKAGKYLPKYQDNKGFYYYGDGFVICEGNPSCTISIYAGGIFVSKNDKTDVRLFKIFSPTDDDLKQMRSESGYVVPAIIKAIGPEYFVYDSNNYVREKLNSLKVNDTLTN